VSPADLVENTPLQAQQTQRPSQRLWAVRHDRPTGDIRCVDSRCVAASPERPFMHLAAFVGLIVGQLDKLAIRCRRNIRYDATAASGFISGNLPFDNRYAG